MKNVCRWKGLLHTYGQCFVLGSTDVIFKTFKNCTTFKAFKICKTSKAFEIFNLQAFQDLAIFKNSCATWGRGRCYAGGPTDVIGPSRPPSSLRSSRRSSRTLLSTTWGPGRCCAGVSVPESLWSYATSVSHQSRCLLPFLLIVFTYPSSSIPTLVIHSFVNSPFSIQSDRSIDLVR